jgi:hypothetical protein
MNLRHGLFRTWLVGSLVWFCGWLFYVWYTCEDRIIPGDPGHYHTFCRTSLFDDWETQPKDFTFWSYLSILGSGLALPLAAFVLGLGFLWAAEGFRAGKKSN